jgi:hypothetical protein
LSEDQDEEEEPDFMAHQIDEEMRKKRVFPSQVEDIEAEKDLGPAMCVTPFAVAPTQEKDIAEEDRMFHEFMKGYHREVHMTGQVLSSLVRAMDAYPSLRLGQLLYCAITRDYQLDGVKDVTDEMLGCALFTIYDEALIEALDKFTEAKMKEKEEK